MKALFTLQNAGMRYGSTQVLRSVNATMASGEFITIAGPNGAGKSTLLTLLAGLNKPTEGRCFFFDKDAALWPRRDFARKVAVVSQSQPLAFPFTVSQVVAMGRMPHNYGLFDSSTDSAAIDRAMQQTETAHFRDRNFRTLSGGEKQRVLLASALAQQTEVLLLDEPSSHLDLQHQVALHQLLRQLAQSGLLVISITHDLNLAAAYADRLILIHDGTVKADGRPRNVLTPPVIREVFGVDAEIGYSSAGAPWLSYGPLHA